MRDPVHPARPAPPTKSAPYCRLAQQFGAEFGGLDLKEIA